MERLITLEQLSEFLGKIVPVRVHFLSHDGSIPHMGECRNMVYVGEFNFAYSCEELVNRTRVLNGISGDDQNVHVDSGRFTIYSKYSNPDRLKRLCFNHSPYEQALRLWDERRTKSQ